MYDMGTREINYSVHCSYKHITGVTKGLKEFVSKVARVYRLLLEENKITDDDKKYFEDLLVYLQKVLKEMQDISWMIYKLEIGLEEYTVTDLALIAATLTKYRVELEKVLAGWLKYLKDKGYEEKDLTSHFTEIHEVLSDMYKIEQDHLPELLVLEKDKDKKSES